MNGSERLDIEALFERAVASEDEAYQRAEDRLRAALGEAAPTLRAKLSHTDPVGRLTARVMLEWAEASGDDFEKANQYLDVLAQRFSQTAAGMPPARAVVQTLSARFGSRLSELLALRLVKQTTWPSWRVMTALGYLDQHKNPATTDALIRFAAQTQVPRFQQAAAKVLAASGDPALPTKLAAEQRRLQQQGAALPTVLASLGGGQNPVA